MAQPVLVKAAPDRRTSTRDVLRKDNRALPPISAYTFASILRTADTTPEFQAAIDGIAEICAKNRMSLADEYASHLPPLGEITAATTTTIRPHLLRPGIRRPLTSVPEGSSGSSQGSGKSLRKSSMFGFRKQQQVQEIAAARRVQIGMMGRTISIGSTTALAAEAWTHPKHERRSSEDTIIALPPIVVSASGPSGPQRISSAAECSLQQLLVRMQPPGE